jgi:hypothetical protein
MNPEQIFSLSGAMAAIGWLALILAPGRRWAAILAGLAIPVALACVYVVLLALYWKGSAGGIGSLREVGVLFSQPWPLVAGWIHYCAFDLVVGAWEARDARVSGVPHLLLVPCLLLSFMFGPAGLLLYLIVRAAKSPGRITAL